MTKTKNKEIRVTILTAPAELKAIDDWSFANRVRSRGEAMRRLLAFGIAADRILSDYKHSQIAEDEVDKTEMLDQLSSLADALHPVEDWFEEMPE